MSPDSGENSSDNDFSDNGARGPWWHQGPEAESGEQPGVGTASQEAIRLAGVVSEWAGRSGLADAIRVVAEQTAGGVRAAAGAAAQPRSAARPAEPKSGTKSTQSKSAATPTAAQPGPAVGGADDGERTPPAHSSAHSSAEVMCDFCPVCQGMAILRAVSPEAADGMADAMAAMTETVKLAMDGLLNAPTDSVRVEHIDIE